MIRIGCAYFQKQNQYASSNKISLSAFNWFVSHKNNSSFESNIVDVRAFDDMVKSDVQTISSHNDQNPNILILIAGISFCSLKILSINGNLIVNIQCIALLQCPVIQKLGLSNCRFDEDNNKIVELKSLKKLNSKKMLWIYLRGNHIQQIANFREWNMPTLQGITLENYSKDEVIFQNALSNVAALQTITLSQLRIKQKKRVAQQKAWLMLEQKFGRKLTEVYE